MIASDCSGPWSNCSGPCYLKCCSYAPCCHRHRDCRSWSWAVARRFATTPLASAPRRCRNSREFFFLFSGFEGFSQVKQIYMSDVLFKGVVLVFFPNGLCSGNPTFHLDPTPQTRELPLQYAKLAHRTRVRSVAVSILILQVRRT